MRRLLGWCWMHALFCTGVLWWTKRRLRRRGATVVLTFHRVLDDEEYARTSSLPGIVTRIPTFAGLVCYVTHHCAPVDVARTHQDSFSRRIPILITFDDGWRDNYVNAFPIVSRYGVPITIFVCPALAGRRFPFWPEAATAWWRRARKGGPAEQVLESFETADDFIEHLKALPPGDRNAILSKVPAEALPTATDEPTAAAMTWDEMHFLADHGVSFGSHTNSHVLLPQLPAEEAQRELVNSRAAIQQELKKDCRLLAYPNGDLSPSVRAEAGAAGYTLGFTTRPGAWLPESDPLTIPRINVWDRKVTGLTGRFSRVAFEYSVFWKAQPSRRPTAQGI